MQVVVEHVLAAPHAESLENILDVNLEISSIHNVCSNEHRVHTYLHKAMRYAHILSYSHLSETFPRIADSVVTHLYANTNSATPQKYFLSFLLPCHRNSREIVVFPVTNDQLN